MRAKVRIKILCVFVAVVFITVACLLLSNNKAHAWTTTDFRPSVVINNDIEAWTNTINEHEQSVQSLQNMINDYENNTDNFAKNIEENEARYNQLHDYIDSNRESLEGLTKISYASYFARKLLENVIGNDVAANTIFKWGVVDFIMTLEDDPIVHLFDDYSDAKNSLDNAVSAEQKAEEMYNNAKIDLERCKNERPALENAIAYWQGILPDIYEIESEYGAAGESYISGDGYFCCPLHSYIISGSFWEQRDGYNHKGVDMCTDSGSPIYAAADGYVFDTGEDASMGNYIKFVTNEGYVVTYMHCSHVYVPSGVYIHRGDNVALVGSTGDSTGPHLHFQLEIDGVPVNPLNYL